MTLGHACTGYEFSQKRMFQMIASIFFFVTGGTGTVRPGVASAFAVSRPFAVQRTERKYLHCNDHRIFRLTLQGSADNVEGSSQDDVVLLALTSTERWIEETLSGLSGMGGGDTYTRKEISYECETRTALADIMSGIFRRLREIREMGEEHGRTMEMEESEDNQSTLRLTSVLVMPSSEELREDYSIFDDMVQRINRARRDARDYVLDDDSTEVQAGSSTTSPRRSAEKWITAVNLSHMHPKFGEDGDDSTDEDESEALKAYKEQRKRARQSPFPTVVLEVKSSPPQPLMSSPTGGAGAAESPSLDPEKDPSVSSEDVKRLEAMFGKTASEGVGEADGKDGIDDDAAAAAVDKFAKSVFSSIGHAQNWVVESDPNFVAEKSTFVASDSRQVDGIYELIFSMISSIISEAESVSAVKDKRDYVILHNFCTKSATSLEKFQVQLSNLVKIIPGLSDVLSVSNFHPEHLDKQKRSPAPILVLQWGSVEEASRVSVEEDGAFE